MGTTAKETELALYEIDPVKMRVAEMLGNSIGRYSADDVAELEAALRIDDPEEFKALCAKWAVDATDEEPPPDPPLPDCLDCRRPMRFGYPPQCEKHPYDEDAADEARGGG